MAISAKGSPIRHMVVRVLAKTRNQRSAETTPE
jgi:hypothetical protein